MSNYEPKQQSVTVAQYSDFNALKKDWHTTKELLEFLRDHGYAASTSQLINWEQAGIIPQPKRVLFKGSLWRVYSKDNTDFSVIILALSQRADRVPKYRVRVNKTLQEL